jgi:Bacitracin resistance protein BacA
MWVARSGAMSKFESTGSQATDDDRRRGATRTPHAEASLSSRRAATVRALTERRRGDITYFQAIVMGILQGITELFPASSLGHSVIMPALFGWHQVVTQQSSSESSFLAFLVGMHVATAIALIVCFRNDWARIVKAFLHTLSTRRAETPFGSGSVHQMLAVTGTTFTVTWAASVPVGYDFDVQIKRPGSNKFVDWKPDTVAKSGTFVPDAGAGTYQFRSRIEKGATGPASGYSAAVKITVS